MTNDFKLSLPMTSRTDEVEAGVDTGVMVCGEATSDLELLLKVVIKLLVYVVHNGSEAVSLVDLVPIAHTVHNGQLLSSLL